MIAHFFTSIEFNRRGSIPVIPFSQELHRENRGSSPDPIPDFLFSVFSSACAVSENFVQKEKKISCGAKKHML